MSRWDQVKQLGGFVEDLIAQHGLTELIPQYEPVSSGPSLYKLKFGEVKQGPYIFKKPEATLAQVGVVVPWDLIGKLVRYTFDETFVPISQFTLAEKEAVKKVGRDQHSDFWDVFRIYNTSGSKDPSILLSYGKNGMSHLEPLQPATTIPNIDSFKSRQESLMPTTTPYAHPMIKQGLLKKQGLGAFQATGGREPLVDSFIEEITPVDPEALQAMLIQQADRMENFMNVQVPEDPAPSDSLITMREPTTPPFVLEAPVDVPAPNPFIHPMLKYGVLK